MRKLAAAGLIAALAIAPRSWTQAPAWPPPTDDPVVTQHQMTVDGKALKYTARAGFLTLRDESNKPHGRIFYVAYQASTDGRKAPRPLTFAWNGGPGSSSSLLHLGALGPFRVKDLAEYPSAPPPYQVTENESTWLDRTDLVFVDPVGTGYSYPAEPELGKEFWSPKGDIASVAEFIRLFLARSNYPRETPIFLVGESYGTLRAAGVASELTDKSLNVAGVVLISLALFPHDERPDLDAISRIPSYTVAAYAHQKLPPDLQQDLDAAIRQSERWAASRYSVALLEGDRLTPQTRDSVARELSRFTGLSEDVTRKHGLRIAMEDFAGMLLADKSEVLGHYDVRATARRTSSSGEYDPTRDPSLDTHGTGAAIVPYLRSQINVVSDAAYAGPFGGRWPPAAEPRGDWMSSRWDWSESASVNGSAALAHAMQANKTMRVLVISGLYDLSTPFSGAEYVFAHMGLDPDSRARAELARYKAGHMVYLDASNRQQLKRDFTALMDKVLAPKPTSTR